MRKSILILMLAGMLCSCVNNSDDNSEAGIVGNYKLTEVYSDPGDGSGTFRPLDSDKTVQFFMDGRVTSNGEICALSGDGDSPSSGTYSVQDSLISSPNCNDLGLELNGNELIIGYRCIEGCAAKYRRI